METSGEETGTSPHRWPGDPESKSPGKVQGIHGSLDQGSLESLRYAGEGGRWKEVLASSYLVSHEFQQPVKTHGAMKGSRSYHPVVQHPVQQRGVVVVLAVQVLTHNLDVCLLPHLLG